MHCGSCGHENPKNGRFCEGRGERLAYSGPACGAEANPAAQFYGSCGAALDSALPPGSPALPVIDAKALLAELGL